MQIAEQLAKVCFVDVETTALDRDVLQVWEVALIRPLWDEGDAEVEWDETVWQLPVDLSTADPMSLAMNGFHERRTMAERTTNGQGEATYFLDPEKFSRRFARDTRGLHLAGANVAFDERALWSLLRANHECPMWHYRSICVETLAAGKLGGLPMSLSKTAETLGLPFDAAHSALGDARMAKDVFMAVAG